MESYLNLYSGASFVLFTHILLCWKWSWVNFLLFVKEDCCVLMFTFHHINLVIYLCCFVFFCQLVLSFLLSLTVALPLFVTFSFAFPLSLLNPIPFLLSPFHPFPLFSFFHTPITVLPPFPFPSLFLFPYLCLPFHFPTSNHNK